MCARAAIGRAPSYSSVTVATQSIVSRFVRIEPGELKPLAAAFGFVFCVFTAYMMLRPVRETMGITGGIANLPILLWLVFMGMLLVQPVIGFLTSRFPRTQFVPWIYLFLALNLGVFYLLFLWSDATTVIARPFYVWISVTNLVAVSIFWSVMADIFRPDQAKRLFGVISAGASTGGVVGPLLTSETAVRLGTIHLLPLAMTFLLLTPAFLFYLVRWQAQQQRTPRAVPEQALGGSALAAFRLVFANKDLLMIAGLIVTLAWVSTYLYLQQAQFVEAVFDTVDERTRAFARIDLAVQILSFLTQLFLFAYLMRWFGAAGTLAMVPLLLAVGCVVFAAEPTFAVLIALQIVRRVGEYSITKPAREVLFTRFDRETKYKAKNLIDTAITRAPEGPAAASYFPLVAAASQTGISWVGAVLAIAAAVLGYRLGRPLDRTAKTSTQLERQP